MRNCCGLSDREPETRWKAIVDDVGAYDPPTKIREATSPERTSISCVQWDIGIKRVVRTRGTIFFTLALPKAALVFRGVAIFLIISRPRFCRFVDPANERLSARMKDFLTFLFYLRHCRCFGCIV